MPPTTPRDMVLRMRLPAPGQQPITTRISGSGSLRRDLEALMAAASAGASKEAYRELVMAGNVTSKASALGRTHAWERLQMWYVLDPAVAEFAAFLRGLQSADSALERGLICLLMLARTDRLFREVTLECVSPHLGQDGKLIDPIAVRAAIEQRLANTGRAATEQTLRKATSNALTAAKDFGVLTGSLKKRTVRPRPGPSATVFAAHLGRLEGLTDTQVPDGRWFRLMGLDRDGALDLLYAAAGAGALTFRQQAGIVDLVLPPLDHPCDDR
jgi:hypothetical protein